MANIFDYIMWRGDIELEKDSFNEVDNLILARLAYFPFDKIIQEDEVVSIKELSQRFQKENIQDMQILWEDDVNLFPAMGDSRRFGNMLVTGYINKIETNLDKQFSAVTILMPDNTMYISYRGTDNTIVGWKEDFNMSFKTHIAAQIDSVEYLETIAKKYPRPIRLGGHSKGGNLAIYAAIFANAKIKERIINIYNNDGPGFRDDVVESKKYEEIIEKVQTFIPQSSVIGRLLGHKEKTMIVKSNQKGIMQHDLYSWQVLGKDFVYLDEITKESVFIDKTITDWLKQESDENREIVVDVLFKILNSTDEQTFKNLKKHWFANAKIIVQSYQKIDEYTKKMMIQTLHTLLRIIKNNLIESNKTN